MVTQEQTGNSASVDRKKANRIALAIAVIAALTLVLAAWTTLSGRGSSQLVFVASANGTPRTDVTHVGPDGTQVTPDKRGIAVVPRSWIGMSISIRDTASWDELAVKKLTNNGGEMIRITVP